MSVTALRDDLSTLARLFREARGGPFSFSRVRRIRRALRHLASSLPFFYVFLLALLITALLTIAGRFPPGAPALLLCYHFGLATLLCALDALVAFSERKILYLCWMLLWTVLLVILTSSCVLYAIWNSRTA